jgi:hypothetical protein
MSTSTFISFGRTTLLEPLAAAAWVRFICRYGERDWRILRHQKCLVFFADADALLRFSRKS